jgi:3-oxoadipate enol-lactonase
MIVPAIAGDSPDIAGAVVLAQTSPAFGKPEGDWQKSFLEARLGPLDRGETMASLAPGLVRNWSATIPMKAAWTTRPRLHGGVPEATYRATMLALMGFDQRHALKNIAVPTLVLSGSKDRNAPAPMMSKMASYIPRRHMSNSKAPDTSSTWSARRVQCALDQFLKAHAAATQ